MNNDLRNLTKWLNEEQETPIDRQALARVLAMAEQPAQQEPVYWQWRRKDQPWSLEYTFNSEVQITTKDSERRALYTSTPAQRTWVGLTNVEIASACKKNGGAEWWWRDIEEYGRAIEAKLKEKNT